jgi:subtilisin family serine protease
MKKTLSAVVAAVFLSSTHAQTETTAFSTLKQGTVDLAWARGFTGRGVTIGVIDQGFDLTHLDFAGKVVATKNFVSPNMSWGIHGTAMAGVAAANKNNYGTLGVAPDAKLVLAQVGTGGTSNTISESAVYRALDWTSLQGASVINLSFGAGYTSNFVNTVYRNPTTGIYFSPSAYGVNYGAANSVIANYQTATNRGSIIVVSAGNQALPYAEFPAMYATRTDFANRLILNGRMIVVGALDSNNKLASFSNAAGHLCQNFKGTQCLDTYLTRDFYVVAPGVNVAVTQPNQLSGNKNTATTMSGTSPAAAYVSGGMALIKQAWPQLRPEQLVHLVLTTTKDLGAPGTDNIYGRGLVDFDRAVAPQGNLVLAARNLVLPSAGLSSTNGSMTAGLVQIFRSTSVLGNIQVLDVYGRNYSADLGRAIMARNPLMYSPDSPWLGFTGYHTQSWIINPAMEIKVISATGGAAAQINYFKGDSIFGLQFGGMQEANGFLGNNGSGGLSLGTGNTTWTQLQFDHAVTDQIGAIAAFGIGTTHVQNNPLSLIEVLTPIQSQSWRLGVYRTNNFLPKDRLSLSIATPPVLKKGLARVSGVTGYDYKDDEMGNTNLVPIVSSEVVNLAHSSKEFNLALSYQHRLTNNGNINYNWILRNNAGGQPGLKDYFFGVNFTWLQ